MSILKYVVEKEMNAELREERDNSVTLNNDTATNIKNIRKVSEFLEKNLPNPIDYFMNFGM